MEFDALVVKESPGLCRCCLSEGCYKDLGSEYQWMNDTEVYADMLFECFDISITQHNDGPNGPNRLICEVCITRLRDACNFKKQVLESEKKFIDMIGRKEFKPQVLVYQSQIKDEDKMEDLCEDAEVEYLEDDILQFGEDDHRDATDLEEPSMSEDITVTTLPVKGKRGRPKKNVKAKTEKAKVPRVEEKKPAKVKESPEDLSINVEKLTVLSRKDLRRQQEELSKLVCIIIENSTALPFRWWPSTFACFHCGCPFQHVSKLKAHTKSEHTRIEFNTVLKQEVSRGKIKVEISELACRKCSKECKTLDDFLIHASESHNFTFNEEAAKYIYSFKLTDDDLSCFECGKGFKFFDTLLKHVYKIHSRHSPYLCEICGQGFVAKSNVESHIRTVHVGRQDCSPCTKRFSNTTINCKANGFKCSKCPEVFTTRYKRQAHLAVVHDVKRYQFQCDICLHQFTKRSKLLYHKSTVHLKEKNLSCTICGFEVFDNRMLKLHMVRHDDSRPFQCDLCKKAFQRKKTLDLHRRIHTNDKRYVCKDCGKTFVQHTSLKLHRRVHHSSA